MWFNISHGSRASLIAASRSGEVGCDIEDRLRADDFERVGPLVLHRNEYRFLNGVEPLSERNAAFGKCWVRKEAVLKARGFGFALEARSVDTMLGSDRPSVGVDTDSRFNIHDAPQSLGIAAAVACVDAHCSWQCCDLASVRAALDL